MPKEFEKITTQDGQPALQVSETRVDAHIVTQEQVTKRLRSLQERRQKLIAVIDAEIADQEELLREFDKG